MRIIKAELRAVKSINVDKLKNKTLEELNKSNSDYSVLLKSIIEEEGLDKARKRKDIYIRNIRDMLENIQEMNLVEYIEHLQGIAKENKKEEEDIKEKMEDIEILDELDPNDQKAVNEQMDNIAIEQRITDLINMKQQDKHIRYHIRF